MLRAVVAPFPLDPADHPGYISGGVYPLYDGTALSTSGALAAVDTLYLFPFIPKANLTPSSLRARVGTAGVGSSIKLGIWANNYQTMRPTGPCLLGNNAGVSTDATGMSVQAVSGRTLAPGVMYWAGIKTTGTPASFTAIDSSNLRIGSMLAANGNFNPTAQAVGVSTPSPYASDITTTDLTGAVFTTLIGATRMPVIYAGV